MAALEESRRKLAEIEQSVSEAEAQQKSKPAEVIKELVKRKVKSEPVVREVPLVHFI